MIAITYEILKYKFNLVLHYLELIVNYLDSLNLEYLNVKQNILY